MPGKLCYPRQLIFSKPEKSRHLPGLEPRSSAYRADVLPFNYGISQVAEIQFTLKVTSKTNAVVISLKLNHLHGT